MMFNPPHPGTVLRDYLGETQVVDAAKHLGVGRVTLSCFEWQCLNLSGYGDTFIRGAGNQSPTCGPG